MDVISIPPESSTALSQHGSDLRGAMRMRGLGVRTLAGIAITAVLGGVSMGCGQAMDDMLYATVPDKTGSSQLATLEIHGINKVTTTVVGAMGAAGCASLARSSAGVMYSVCGPGILKADLPQQLATIDLKTGHATLFGQAVTGLQVMGLEFAPDGTLYAAGDANAASPTYNSLYTVDTKTGAFTRVGATGAPANEFLMDLAFDRNGTMYGASSHMLFTIDPKTGTATKVSDFVGGGDIMGLSFDAKKDRLYATDFKMPSSALYLVDLHSGFLTPVASVGRPFSHGLVPTN
jgi:DNA-binding beta-propeller fold protein YncE